MRVERRVYAIVKDICRLFTAAHGSGQIIIWTQGTGACSHRPEIFPIQQSASAESDTPKVATTCRSTYSIPSIFPVQVINQFWCSPQNLRTLEPLSQL